MYFKSCQRENIYLSDLFQSKTVYDELASYSWDESRRLPSFPWPVNAPDCMVNCVTVCRCSNSESLFSMQFYPLLLTGDHLVIQFISISEHFHVTNLFFSPETLTGFLATKSDDVLMNELFLPPEDKLISWLSARLIMGPVLTQSRWSCIPRQCLWWSHSLWHLTLI